MPRKDKTFHPADLFRIWRKHLTIGEQIELVQMFLGGWSLLLEQRLLDDNLSGNAAVVRQVLGDWLVLRYAGRDVRNIVEVVFDVFNALQQYDPALVFRSLTRRGQIELRRGLQQANPIR